MFTMKLLALLLYSALSFGATIDNQISSVPTNFGTPDVLSRRGELEQPSSVFDVVELNKVLFSEIKEQDSDLKRVKYYLVNGEIRLARAYLNRLTYTRSKLKPIVYRYLGILHFIEGNFAKSYLNLSKPELNTIPHYSKICALKVINQIALNKTSGLEQEWARCRVENPRNFVDSNLVWLETLVELKANPRPGLTKVPFRRVKLVTYDNDDLKIMMKLALYLNQEKLLQDQIPELNVEQLQDLEVRELAGQILFRLGSLAKSYKFIEDLKSPNAENIKGNLYVLRQKYELAYAQFKLALEQKQNSQNAMERLLPLAWLLGDWEKGSEYAERVIALPQTQMNKLTLFAAFLTQKSDFEQAAKVLETIAQKSRRGTEIDVTQLSSFVALMQNRPDHARKNAELSCAQYDLVNCWILMQLTQWDSFALTLRRPEELPARNSWEKLLKEDVHQPLKETVYVNQLDIEELDDKLIQLIPAKAP